MGIYCSSNIHMYQKQLIDIGYFNVAIFKYIYAMGDGLKNL